MEIDVERMRAVRDAVGAAVELLIDANQGGVDAAPGDRRPEAHGGADETRTRDLRRDRPGFFPWKTQALRPFPMGFSKTPQS